MFSSGIMKGAVVRVADLTAYYTSDAGFDGDADIIQPETRPSASDFTRKAAGIVSIWNARASWAGMTHVRIPSPAVLLFMFRQLDDDDMMLALQTIEDVITSSYGDSGTMSWADGFLESLMKGFPFRVPASYQEVMSLMMYGRIMRTGDDMHAMPSIGHDRFLKLIESGWLADNVHPALSSSSRNPRNRYALMVAALMGSDMGVRQADEWASSFDGKVSDSDSLKGLVKVAGLPTCLHDFTSIRALDAAYAAGDEIPGLLKALLASYGDVPVVPADRKRSITTKAMRWLITESLRRWKERREVPPSDDGSPNGGDEDAVGLSNGGADAETRRAIGMYRHAVNADNDFITMMKVEEYAKRFIVGGSRTWGWRRLRGALFGGKYLDMNAVVDESLKLYADNDTHDLLYLMLAVQGCMEALNINGRLLRHKSQEAVIRNAVDIAMQCVLV